MERTTTTKTQLALDAREKGQRTFEAFCKKHGRVTTHHASNARCKECKDENNAIRNSKRTERMANDLDFLGASRESWAANSWRKDTGGTMPALYGIERDAIRRLYAKVPEGCDVDHCVPKAHKDVTGLHCFANLQYLTAKVNRAGYKANTFRPDDLREQRPANRGPGGAFDPTPTAEEAKRIRRATRLGVFEAEQMETLRNSLEARAAAYEGHYADVLEPAFIAQWMNAVELLIAVQGSRQGIGLTAANAPSIREAA